MKTTKRLLSIVLALAMLLTMASFPAMAADYTYEPKTVTFEGSKTWWNDYGGQRGIIRPTNDFYVGDKLSFGDGVVVGQKPTVTVSGTAYDIVGFRFDYNNAASGGAWLGRQKYVKVETVDGVTTLKGFYNSQDDMLAGTATPADIDLPIAGKWGFAWGAIYYYNAEGALTTIYGSLDNTGGWNKTYSFFLDVKEVPTSEPVTAPEVLNGVKESATALDISTFVTDPESENFTAENNLYYLSFVTFDGSAATKSFYAVKKAPDITTYNGYQEGPRFEFAQKAYIKDVTINIEQGYLKYDVFGSLDNENWYPLTIGGESSGSNNHKIAVDGVAKYLRVDIRAVPLTWNTLDGGVALKGVTATLNVPDAWTVTVDGLAEGTYTTDINGVVDLSDLVNQFPASEYAFYVDDENVTDEIVAGTYAFTGNKTLTVSYAPYDYVPKTVYLDGAKYSFPWAYATGGKYIVEAPTDELYEGDKLAIKPGTPVVAPAKNNGALRNTSVTFTDSTTIKGYKVYFMRTRYPDAASTYYIGIKADASSSTGYVLTGLYKTVDDMYNETNQVEITLTRSPYTNVWTLALGGIYYSENGGETQYVSREGLDNMGWDKTYMWFITLREAPTVKNYDVEAPAVLNGLADNVTTLTSADFVADPATADLTTQNIFGYVANTIASNGDLVLKHSASGVNAFTHLKGFKLSFKEDKVFVKDIALNGFIGYAEFDVWGSLDNVNWYKLSIDNKVTKASNKLTIPVNGIGKYFFLDFKASQDNNSNFSTHPAVSEVTVVTNPKDSWTVTITDGKNYNEVVTTDINGNFDYSDLTTLYPTDEFAYFVGEENITAAIVAGTYKANGDVTINIGYDYKEKTVGIPASGNTETFCGPLFISRPTNDLYVGDMLTILEGTKAKVTVSGCSTAVAFKVVVVDPEGNTFAKYVKIDENGNYTGLYDAKDGTTAAPITLTKAGKWGFAVTEAYDASGTNLLASSYLMYYTLNADGTYRGVNQCGMRFYLDVKATPQVKDYQAKAPTVIAGLASQSAALTIDTTDITKAWVSEPNTTTGTFLPSVKKLAYNTYVRGYGESVNLVLDDETYVESFVFDNVDSKTIVYDVFGSIDGENWYAISVDNTTNVRNTTVEVGTIVKHIRVDIRDMYTHWGRADSGWAIKNVIGVKAVYAWNVTFTDGTNTETVTTDANGFYTVPAQFQGDVNYYSDSAYTTKLNTAVPAKGDMTVYVKANVWEYTPKTVSLQKKLGARGCWNYFFKAPKDQIFVGDTVTVDAAVLQDVIATYQDIGVTAAYKGYPIVGYSLEFIRLYDNASSTAGKYSKVGTFRIDQDPTNVTFDKAGIYVVCLYKAYIENPETGEVETVDSVAYHDSWGSYSTIIEVKEAPTSATAVKAPATSETGTVTTLVAYDDETAYTTDKASVFVAGSLKGDTFKTVDANNNVEGIGRKVLNGDYNTNGLSSYVLDIQINLGQATYVETLTLRETSYNSVNDCAIYGSLDGENWYPLAINPKNTKSGNFNNFTVKGVAQYLKVTNLDFSNYAKMTLQYGVTGYYLTGEATTFAPSWVAHDGDKTEITSVKELPVAYADGSTNYAVTGWQMTTVAGLIDVSLADLAKMEVSELGDLHAIVEEIPVEAAALTGTLTAKGADEGMNFGADKFINGFYIQGAQIRVPSGEGAVAVKSGLRYVNILDNALITKLNELKSAGTVKSYEYGTLAVAETKYVGGDLEIGGTNVAKSVGEKIFADAGDFENAYFKYTVCIVDIPEKNYATNIIVRPYLTINMTDGSSVTLYGEQYATSVYSAAKFALANDADLTTEEIAYLESVVNVVEG